ncbi:GNAT family N-acetyltransferase [Vibrio salilacus]|uniref:GNAT family N-acetyltransferase n=1 Tax=Vibrio salilacus TaxID=1323749 RepID=UPI000C2A94B1|nr:GNAT family N-acetyltransferase [Vibrio salilacus]
MTIVTRRSLLVPYNESLQSEFLMLNCCGINRAQMNGAHTVSSAKQLFEKTLNDPNLYAMAVLDSRSRAYVGHIFICALDSEPELGFIFDKLYWGIGFASEALQAFFPKVVRDLSLTNVVATANIDHQPSIRILKKLGFQFKVRKQDAFGPYNEYLFTSDVAVDQPSLAEILA